MKKTLLILSACLLFSCSSDDNDAEIIVCPGEKIVEWITYPEITTVGKNTFAFKVDESEFISHFMYVSSLTNPSIKALTNESLPYLSLKSSYYLDTITKEYVLTISARGQRSSDSVVVEYRSIDELKEGDTLLVRKTGTEGTVSIMFNKKLEGNSFDYIGVEGEFRITKLDINKRILSGTFHFVGEEDGGKSESIIAFDGRFDLLFAPGKWWN